MPAVCAMGCAVAGLAAAASSEMKNPPAFERPTPEREETLVDLAVFSMRTARLCWLANRLPGKICRHPLTRP